MSTRPNVFNGGVDQFLQVGDLADIGIDADGLVAEGRYLLLQSFRRLGMRDVINDDVGALFGQLQHDGLADAAVAAGNNSNFTF